MPRTISFAIGAGVLSALFFALVLTSAPEAFLITPFSMLPLLLIGMSGTATTTALSAIAGIIVFGLISGGIGWAALYAATEAVPAYGLSRLALRRRPDANGRLHYTSAGTLYTVATLYAAAFVIVLHLAFFEADSGFFATLQAIIQAGLGATIGRGAAPAEVQQLAAEIAMGVPGALAGWWLVILLGNLAITQALLTRWKSMQRPPLWLSRMTLPRWLAGLTLAALLYFFIAPSDAGFLGKTFAVILFLPCFFVGLVCIHYLCRGWPPGPFVLAGVYLILFIVLWPTLIAATILGIAEQWIRLRERLGGPQPV